MDNSKENEMNNDFLVENISKDNFNTDTKDSIKDAINFDNVESTSNEDNEIVLDNAIGKIETDDIGLSIDEGNTNLQDIFGSNINNDINTDNNVLDNAIGTIKVHNNSVNNTNLVSFDDENNNSTVENITGNNVETSNNNAITDIINLEKKYAIDDSNRAEKKIRKKSKLPFILTILVIIAAVVYICFETLVWPRIKSNIVKPVLYIYPTEDTNVKVTFKRTSLLTTTYPKFNKEWNVFVKKDGSIYDENGRYYYALYWEEEPTKDVDFTEGFYVEDKDAINFLEEKLDIIGLNDREANEFIMYWLPILESNKKSLVYFELTDEKQKTNELIIDPKPDSMLRLTIHVKKIDKKTNIKEEKLEHFNRTGYAVVEWGGRRY